MTVDRSLLRRIPQVDQLLQDAAFGTLLERFSRTRVTAALRQELDQTRVQARSGQLDPAGLNPTAIAARVSGRLGDETRAYYRRVINATGVVLHTGLGRAPLPAAAAAAIQELGPHPQRLEIDLESGERGGRDGGCAALLTRILGCEAATVVNNNAAATLVALAALAEGKKVVLSRGELVEIGGSYRVPEIIRQSGARLAEIGTTNRTHLADYQEAIDDRVGALLKVHTSNYQVVGFTSAVEIGELVAIGREAGVPVIHDLGSGCLIDLETFALPGDQQVQASLAAGADLVCFSGDKLLGGPQAGVLAGTHAAIERCRAHPLFRAMRPGRMIYSALEATLQLYLDGDETAVAAIPALRQLAIPPSDLEQRARALAARFKGVDGIQLEVVECVSQAGSGALPLVEIPSWGLRVYRNGVSAEEFARGLRTGEPAVLSKVRDGAVELDLRTVEPDEIDALRGRLGKKGTGTGLPDT